MSTINNLIIDIQDELRSGQLSFAEIAMKFECPLSWVDTVAQEMMEEEYNDE
jgi:hypothetical protein